MSSSSSHSMGWQNYHKRKILFANVNTLIQTLVAASAIKHAESARSVAVHNSSNNDQSILLLLLLIALKFEKAICLKFNNSVSFFKPSNLLNRSRHCGANILFDPRRNMTYVKIVTGNVRSVSPFQCNDSCGMWQIFHPSC